eukprot:TRINITY_DN208_c0_g1_i1.p1 TRINITY_DN208_c0_g1~~TRINITY_DN208_c0_g1_i1.p1  ORF type:complete len:728 (-),score=370.10 TRINITY_DN208_c0_g1_i1:257-2440(-)
MAEGAVHHFSESERRGYVDFINQDLAKDPEVSSVLPINPDSDDVFDVISDGVLLARLMNNTFEGTIDDAKLCTKPKNMFEKNLNHDLVLAGAQKLKLATVNIGANDFLEKRAHLVMGLMWQIIKRVLMHKISMFDLSKLAAADEAIEKVPPEQMLLRWFNYHLKNAGHDHRVVTNFSSDISDAECYAVLIHQIAGGKVTDEELESAFRAKDSLRRAEIVLGWAKRLDCLQFVGAQDVVDGNPRLNLAFVATLFEKFPSLGPTEQELLAKKLSDTESKLTDFESLLTEANSAKDSLQEELDATKLDFDQLSMDLGDMKLELGNVKGERDDAMEKIGSLEEMLELANNEKADLSSQLSAVTQEKDDLFAQLEEEMSLKLDLEGELSSTKNELEEFKTRSADQIQSLTEQLENEISLKNDLTATLEDTMMELESTRAKAKETEEDLLAKLAAETESRESLEAQLAGKCSELEDTIKLKEEAEQTKDDLFKLLTDTISELESTKKAGESKENELTTALDEERKSKESFALQLQEKSSEFEKCQADWAEERAKLLARIKELEDELEALKNEMREKLEQAEKEKEEALAKAKSLMESALGEAEHEKNAALDKMRMLLTGSQKIGYLSIYMVSGLLQTKSWTKRYFVLRDNLFSWYKDEAHQNKKPLGVIYVEEARLYEMEEADVGRPLCFQITTSGGQKWNIAAESMEEMRSWMTEIRVAKKKKLGHKVVAAS